MKARIDSQAVEIGEELVARCDRPLPRYTSYPPAPAWGAMDGAGFNDHSFAAHATSSRVASSP